MKHREEKEKDKEDNKEEKMNEEEQCKQEKNGTLLTVENIRAIGKIIIFCIYSINA